MRLAIVHDWLNGMRGGEKILEALLEMHPEAEVFTLFYEPERVSETIRAAKVHVSGLQKLPGARERYRSFLPLFPRAVAKFDLGRFDRVISISHCVAKAARAAAPERHVSYVLTPMRYIWSQQDAYLQSDEMSYVSRAGLRAITPYLQGWDRSTCQRVGRFLAISETVAQRIRETYHREAEVIYPPVDVDFFTENNEPDNVQSASDYYLCVSALVPYKRIDLAIQACARLRVPLKIVGTGPGEARLRELATRLGAPVGFFGWVDPDTLRKLYRNCRALIFPGEEDFGIAPVEAQACGRPVVAFNRGGATETVVHGETGFLHEAQTAECIVDAIEELANRAIASEACVANAERFDTARFKAEFERVALE